ncbi:MAG: T9SS type A sorting domain-containing protein [Candidatus Cyclobacteriaceae bacterium M3_2C_046]
MKRIFLLIALGMFISITCKADLVWVAIRGGKSTYCPNDNHTVTYTLDHNYTNFKGVTWKVTNGGIYINGVYQGTQIVLTRDRIIDVVWNNINGTGELRATAYGDYTWFHDIIKEDYHEVALVEKATPSLVSSVSALECGSTASVSFTANVANADRYIWNSTTGSLSGGNSNTQTVTPNSGTTNLTVEVKGFNETCQLYSNPQTKTIYRSGPSISYIYGPSDICYGGLSVESHRVTYNSNWSYDWSGTGYTFQPGANPATVFIQASSTGNKTLQVKVTNQCNKTTTKTKSVSIKSGAPGMPYPDYIPYHCAGACESYSINLGTNATSHEWYSPTLSPYWTDFSGSSFLVCTDNYDVGYHDIWVKAKNVCGYSSTLTFNNQIDDCYYMSVYPNPASQEITIELGDNITTSELTIYDDKNNLIKKDKVKNEKTKTLNISDLNTGKYIIELTCGNYKKSKILIVK